MFGLALARRARSMSLAERPGSGAAPFRELGARTRPEGVACQRRLRTGRVAAGGELVDLPEDDIKLWMLWLGWTTCCIAERS